MTDGIVDGIVDKATSAIIAADLTPIEHRILVGFIKEAEEPTLAAQEVLDRICDDGRLVEETLRVLKNDWHNLVAVISRPTPVDAALKDLVGRRDQFRCCVTPHDCQQVDAPEPTFIIPPVLSELGDVDGAEHLSKSLLDAFMTPSGASRLRSMLLDRSDPGRIANTLLLTPSILRAFRNGHLHIRLSGVRNWNTLDEDAATDVLKAEYILLSSYPERYKDIFLADRSSFYGDKFRGRLILQTEDPKQLPLPSPFLIKTHYKFGNALHQFYVEERIASGWGPLASPSYLSRNMQLFARTLWHIIPKFIRTTCYCYLLNKGKSKYVQEFSGLVQQLPLGLYAKRCDRAADNEFNALRLVEQHAPSIPAPLLIDTYHDAGVDWFIMTGLPGLRVHDVLHRMSYPERHQLAADLSNVITQMHKIHNDTPYRYANVSGGPINDGRLDCEDNGPFNSEADLNARIACGIQSYLTKHVPSAFSRSHASVFTHGDLFFTNVLVDGGRLSGIVDWESASYMPAYWEFTKAMRTAMSDEATAIYREVWGEEFEVELETERFLWNSFPLGG